METKKTIKELSEICKKIKKKGIPLSSRTDFTDYKATEAKYLIESYKNGLQRLQNMINDANVPARVNELLRLLDYNDLDKNMIVLEGLAGFDIEIKPDRIGIYTTRVPDAIKAEVEADIMELRKCFDSGCYRSCVILCGRIMEVCLHAKYFKVTGFDILEKNPGIGLGKLIAKMIEKGIKLDPGLTSQIHLINNVRIFSVHKKQRTFVPSKAQTEAIMLFTSDVVDKLF